MIFLLPCLINIENKLNYPCGSGVMIGLPVWVCALISLSFSLEAVFLAPEKNKKKIKKTDPNEFDPIYRCGKKNPKGSTNGNGKKKKIKGRMLI